MRIEINGAADYSTMKIRISPNGRYIFYAEHETSQDEEVKHSRAFDELGNSENFSKPQTPSVGKIIELVMDPTTKKFSIELWRTIDDFEARYGVNAYSFNSKYDTGSLYGSKALKYDFYITNNK